MNVLESDNKKNKDNVLIRLFRNIRHKIESNAKEVVGLLYLFGLMTIGGHIAYNLLPYIPSIILSCLYIGFIIYFFGLFMMVIKDEE